MTFQPERFLFLREIRESAPGYGDPDTCQICHVCETIVADNEAWDEHAQESTHKERCAQISRLMEIEKRFSFRRREVVSLKKPRISTLGLQAWRDRVNSLLLEYMTNAESSDVAARSKLAAIELLEKYELMEQVSLLELTIWKTCCQMSKPSGRTGDSFDYHCWLSSGWKQRKEEMRNSNAIAIVITHVFPFLLGDCSNKKARHS